MCDRISCPHFLLQSFDLSRGISQNMWFLWTVETYPCHSRTSILGLGGVRGPTLFLDDTKLAGSAELYFVVVPVGIRRYCSRLLEGTDILWALGDYYLLAQLKVTLELFCLLFLLVSTRNLRYQPKDISIPCILHLHGIYLCSSISSWVSTK